MPAAERGAAWSECSARYHQLVAGFVGRLVVIIFIFGRFAAKNRGHVHLVKALLFAVPCAG